jgi:hypothetical protein
LSVLVPLSILLCTGASGVEIDQAVLDKVKGATAFVTCRTEVGMGSGSAFLIGRKGKAGYLVTSSHVVSRRGRTFSDIRVTFHSGTTNEFELSVMNVCADKDVDLAILKVESDRLPAPISLEKNAVIEETTPVVILGFPFGKSLSLTDGAPSLTVARGSVSSIRRDENGVVKVIQIDGNLNPGNSGGPVLTHDGALVGVSTATVIGTQIGLTIPKSEILNLLMGKVSGISYEALGAEKRILQIRVNLEFVDPLEKITSAYLFLALKSKVTAPPTKKAGQWSKLFPADITKPVSVESGKASVTLSIPISSEKDVYLAQASFSSRGQTEYTEPGEWELGMDLDFAERKAGRDKQAGTASKGWLGEADTGRPETAPQPKQVITVGKSVAEAPRIVLDASVVPLGMGGERVSYALWSRDGERFYALTSDGDLHEVAIPNLVETRRVSIGSACSDIALSREGLLVLNSAGQSLLVLDEKTLAVTASVDTGGLVGLTAVPDSSVAFIGKGMEMSMVDLRKRKIAAKYNPYELQQKYGNRILKHKNGVVLSEFGAPRMSPDGLYLFCVGFECLHRFRILGQELVYEEMGPRIGGNSGRIEMSDAGNYVALPCGGGNSAFDGQSAKSYSTFVFAAGNLQKTVVVVESGHYPRCLAFDEVQKCIWSMNYDNNLIRFSATGEKLKSYQISSRGQETDQILVQPKGKGLLVSIAKKLHWCQMDNGARASTLPDDAAGPGTKSFELWKFDASLYTRMLTNAPAPGPTGLSKKMPELPFSAVPAYGGVYVVMQFKDLRKLGIFNIAQARFDKYISLEDPDSVYAAGGNLLLIFSPKEKTFQRWNLATLELVDSKTCPMQFPVTEMAMAMECSKLAVASMADTSDQLGKRSYALLDTTSLKVLPFAEDTRFRNTHFRDWIHIRLDPRFNAFTLWSTSVSPCGFTYGALRGQTVQLTSEHVDHQSLSLSMNAKTVYCSDGSILDTAGKVLQTFPNAQLFPVYGSDGYLEWNGQKANFRDPIANAVMFTIDLPFVPKRREWSKTKFTDDRKVFACAPLKRIVFINESDLTAYVFAMDAVKAVASPSAAGAGTPSGSRWTQKLNFSAGSKIVLEDAPEGMKYDASTASLVWDIPAGTRPGERVILLSVTAPGKAEEFHKIPMTVR